MKPILLWQRDARGKYSVWCGSMWLRVQIVPENRVAVGGMWEITQPAPRVATWYPSLEDAQAWAERCAKDDANAVLRTFKDARDRVRGLNKPKALRVKDKKRTK